MWEVPSFGPLQYSTFELVIGSGIPHHVDSCNDTCGFMHMDVLYKLITCASCFGFIQRPRFYVSSRLSLPLLRVQDSGWGFLVCVAPRGVPTQYCGDSNTA